MPLLLSTETNPGTADWTDAEGVVSPFVGVRQLFSSLADSDPIITAPGNTPFNVSYAVPAGTLGEGHTLRCRAVVRVNTSNGADLQLIGRVGGADVLTTPNINVGLNSTVMLEWWILTRAAAGPAVDTVGGGTGTVNTAISVDAPNGTQATLADGTTLATEEELIVDVTATWTVSDDSSCFLESLVVDHFRPTA